jgi:hypothetical protein
MASAVAHTRRTCAGGAADCRQGRAQFLETTREERRQFDGEIPGAIRSLQDDQRNHARIGGGRFGRAWLAPGRAPAGRRERPWFRTERGRLSSSSASSSSSKGDPAPPKRGHLAKGMRIGGADPTLADAALPA